MQESTHRRRPRGGGTIYRVGDRWRGSISVRDEDGRRIRRYVSGDTSAEVVARRQAAEADATEAAERAKSPIAGRIVGLRRCSDDTSGRLPRNRHPAVA